MLKSCFLSSFVEFYSAVSEEKLKMSQPIRGLGGHFVFPIHMKNTNLVEGVEILLPIKFRRIPFSGFRGEVDNVSANQMPGFVFPDLPEKHKRGRRLWELASCQVSLELLNSVQRFQRRSQSKMSRPIRGQGGHFIFPIGPKNTNLLGSDHLIFIGGGRKTSQKKFSGCDFREKKLSGPKGRQKKFSGLP